MKVKLPLADKLSTFAHGPVDDFICFEISGYFDPAFNLLSPARPIEGVPKSCSVRTVWSEDLRLHCSLYSAEKGEGDRNFVSFSLNEDNSVLGALIASQHPFSMSVKALCSRVTLEWRGGDGFLTYCTRSSMRQLLDIARLRGLAFTFDGRVPFNRHYDLACVSEQVIIIPGSPEDVRLPKVSSSDLWSLL